MSLKKKYILLCKSLLKENIDVVPKGWNTCEQISKASGKSIPQTGRILKAAINQKKVETKKFKIHTGARVLPIAHYRFL